jgi:hypothetical protein
MATHGKRPTVVYALDSADVTLLERWMAEGRLPHMAELWRNSARHRIGGPGYWDEIGTWITAYSGVPATRHGYYSARRLQPGTYELEIVPLTAARSRPCWESVQDPLFKALILEPIEGFPSSRVAGAQLYNLTVHQEAYAAAPVIAIPSAVETQTDPVTGEPAVGSVLRTANAFIDGPSELLTGSLRALEVLPAFLRPLDSSQRRGQTTAPCLLPRFLPSGTGLRCLQGPGNRAGVA